MSQFPHKRYKRPHAVHRKSQLATRKLFNFASYFMSGGTSDIAIKLWASIRVYTLDVFFSKAELGGKSGVCQAAAAAVWVYQGEEVELCRFAVTRLLYGQI
jgi:hypothetical protein